MPLVSGVVGVYPWRKVTVIDMRQTGKFKTSGPGGDVFLYLRAHGTAHVMTLTYDGNDGRARLRGEEFDTATGGWRGFHACAVTAGAPVRHCRCSACVKVVAAA